MKAAALTAAVLLVCIFGSLLMLAAITAGHRVMCATHDDALSYCPGYSSGAAK